jgi:excisionase family DNA binding protein
MRTVLDTLAPSAVSKEDLDALRKVLNDQPSLVGREGFIAPLPDPIFHLLLYVVRSIEQGKSITLIPENEALTTQAAANFLGVSRPYLVRLLQENKIPHHSVGSHRRVLLDDLRTYAKARDIERRTVLDELFDKIDEEGLYFDEG